MKPPAPKTLLAVGVALAGTLVLRRAWQTHVRQKTYDAAAASGDSPEGLANAIRQALNPSGVRLLRHIDTTDEAALFAIAPRIRNLTQVAQAYRRLFQSELLEDLRQELSPDEYQVFMAATGKLGRTKQVTAPQSDTELLSLASSIHEAITAWGPADTSRLLSLAVQVKDLGRLREMYQRQYRRSLDEHLRSQWTFSTRDYESFIRLASL